MLNKYCIPFILLLLISCTTGTYYTVGDITRIRSTNSNHPERRTRVEKGAWITGDIQINHFTDGAGTPVLIIHGGPGEPYKKPWEGLKRLNGGNQFVYYDQRGCGKSTRPVDRFPAASRHDNREMLIRKLGLQENIDDIERIRLVLHRDKIIIMGHSFGGFLAALYAVEYPDHVEKLILVSPAPLLRSPLPNDQQLYAIIYEQLSAPSKAEYSRLYDLNNIFAKDEKSLALQNIRFFTYYFEYLTNIGLSESVQKISNLVDMERIGGWLPQAYSMSVPETYDWTRSLSAITAPTIIVYGDRDICSEKMIRQYSDHMKNAAVYTIPHCGHWPFEEQPEIFERIAGDFLRK